MNNKNLILAIETSCDDTSIALVDNTGFVLAQFSASQDDKHRVFGGIVPEIASRNHTIAVLPLVENVFRESGKNWANISGIAVTSRPGLLGSLLVGVMTAKMLALVNKIPFVGVNHLEGHLLAPFLRDAKTSPPEGFGFPFLGLVVSGGHTTIYEALEFGKYKAIGATLDDAAGEAFDKFAIKVGLGFPGGAKVDTAAKSGHVDAFNFPRALTQKGNLNFSFSGLKTFAQDFLNKMPEKERDLRLNDLCASFQEAIVDQLINKLKFAQEKTKLKQVIISGGVSANSRLRFKAKEWADAAGLLLVLPPIRYCTDNAAMIGYVGMRRLALGLASPQSLGPSARSFEGDFC